MSDLGKLIEHIDYFFERIPSIYDSAVKYEIYLKDKKWLISNLSTGQQFGTTKAESVLSYLKEKNVDLIQLHVLIHQSVVTEGVLRRMQQRKVEALIGKEAIDEGEEAWDEFGKGLAEALGQKKTELKVVE